MINKAKQLNKALKDSVVSKEYFALKESISNDEYLKELLSVIKDTQTKAKQCLTNNDIANYKIHQMTLEVLKQDFINNPLVNNYILCKNELEALLTQVVDILSD